MQNVSQIVQKVLSAYNNLLTISIDDVEKIGIQYPIPFFRLPDLIDLCNEVITFYMKNDIMYQISAPIYVVGDIHGNIFDLIRIFLHAELPPRSRFIFLGDYVDRGFYSIEVVTLLFALMLRYPGHILLLRGNHEFLSLNDAYGFKTEVYTTYNTLELYEKFNETFSWMPLAAIINQDIFCVHGGLSPNLIQPSDITSLVRPIVHCDGLVSHLVWSDPSETTQQFQKSARGTGFLFGEDAVDQFITSSKCKIIIRAHQCVPMGVQKSFNGKIYTVFSSSNYAEVQNNRCGILFITKQGKIQSFSLPPLSLNERNLVTLHEYPFEATATIPTLPSVAISHSLFEITPISHSLRRKNNNTNVKGSSSYGHLPSLDL